jgi:isochorismate hydrolase
MVSEFITPEMEKKLVTLEKHSAYLRGYSEGMWSMWRGKQLIITSILIVIVIAWIAVTIYMAMTGAC